MLKRVIASIIATVLLLSIAHSQYKYEIGIEAAFVSDKYAVVDANRFMKIPILITGNFSLKLRKNMKSNFFIEAAAGGKSYEEGVGFRFTSGYSQSMTTLTGMMQLRIGKKINIQKDKLSIAPVIGYAFCINGYPIGDTGGGAGYTIKSSGDSLSYSHNSLILRKTFSLIQAGITADLFLSKRLTLEIYTNAYLGLNNVFEQDVTYKINNHPSETGKQTSKGSFRNLGIGIKYSFKR